MLHHNDEQNDRSAIKPITFVLAALFCFIFWWAVVYAAVQCVIYLS